MNTPVWTGVPTLLVEFSTGDEEPVSVTTEGESILVRVEDTTFELARDEAARLQEELAGALTERREFFRTAGEHRRDGSYVVSRRGADSAGNAKVFESFEALGRLYDRLPSEFTAEDVGRNGITGSRRHMLLRHLAEHPGFDCDISRRNPLTAEKTSGTGSSETAAGSEGGNPDAEAAWD